MISHFSTLLLRISNPFVCKVLSTSEELHFSDAAAISDANIGDQTIWLNSLIRIDNRPAFHKHWVGHGICKISHLLDGGGDLLGYDVMKSNFQDLNWLEFFGIVSAVKSFINKLQNEPMCKAATSTAINLVLLERYMYSSKLARASPCCPSLS